MQASGELFAEKPRIVGGGVDWYAADFSIVLGEGVEDKLREAVDRGERFGRSSVRLEGANQDGDPIAWDAEVRAAGRRNFLLVCEDSGLRVMVEGAKGSSPDADAGAGKSPVNFNVHVDVSGAFLTRAGLGGAREAAEIVAGLIGAVKARRLKRLDLCLDVENFPLDDETALRLVKRSRSKIGQWRGREHVDDDEHGAALYRMTGKVTGVTVSQGNSVSARIYDKRQEVERSYEKRVAIEARWKAAGWTDTVASRVVRVEFQLTSEALEELGLRSLTAPGLLETRLDAVWRYLTGVEKAGWLRHVDLGSASRMCRALTSDAWALVQSYTWEKKPERAAVRVRRRGFARAAQTMGCAMGMIAKELKPIAFAGLESGVVISFEERVAKMRGAEASAFMRERLRQAFQEAAEACAVELEARFGVGRAACLALLERIEAVRSRAAGVPFRPSIHKVILRELEAAAQ